MSETREDFAARLEREWLEQKEISDFRNWLVEQLWRAEAGRDSQSQEWISVEERLPDDPKQEVLVFFADNWDGDTNFMLVTNLDPAEREDAWGDGRATHWRELPSPIIAAHAPAQKGK